MAIGQGAGIAAALASKQGAHVQEVNYPDLKKRLLAQGMVLELPGPIAPFGRRTTTLSRSNRYQELSSMMRTRNGSENGPIRPTSNRLSVVAISSMAQWDPKVMKMLALYSA